MVSTTLMPNTGFFGNGFKGITFIDCKFEAGVYFNKVYIEPTQDLFKRSEFFDNLYFQDCMCLRTFLDFFGSTFHKRLQAESSKLEVAIRFDTTIFLPGSQVFFNNSEIDTIEDWHPTTRVYQTEFQYDTCNIGQYRSSHSIYAGSLLFRNCKFGNIPKPLFGGGRRSSSTVFLDLNFKAGCKFERDEFHGETAFINVSFGPSSVFQHTNFQLGTGQFIWSTIQSEAPLMGISEFPAEAKWMTSTNPRLTQRPYDDFKWTLQPRSQALGELVDLYKAHNQDIDSRTAYYQMKETELDALRAAGPSRELAWAEFMASTWGFFTAYGTRWDWALWWWFLV